MTLTHSWPGAQKAESPMVPGRPRILGVPPATSLGDHERRYGPLSHELLYSVIPEIEAAGLRGRGGAAFPTHVKMKAVEAAARRAGGRRAPVVVANGTEGEPASAKDKTLIRLAPHLVVDGIVAAAAAVGAKRAILCIDRAATSVADSAYRALVERQGRDPVPIEVALTPSRYLAGEETALVSWLNGGRVKPTFAPPRPSDKGVGGAPTLVDNVETLANVALIARYGAEAYRLVGEDDEPGSILVTVRGAVERPAVYETELGVSVGRAAPPGGSLPAVRGAGRRLLRHVDQPERHRPGRPEFQRDASGRGIRRMRPGGGNAGGSLSPLRGGASVAVAGGQLRGPVRGVRQRPARSVGGVRRARDRRSQRRRRPSPRSMVGDGGGARGVQAAGWGRPVSGERPPGLRLPHRSPSPGWSVPAKQARASSRAAARGLVMSLRIVVNPVACDGHGICAELLPELVSLDDWGYPMVRSEEVPPHLERLARRVRDACPTLAIRLTEARS